MNLKNKNNRYNSKETFHLNSSSKGIDRLKFSNSNNNN